MSGRGGALQAGFTRFRPVLMTALAMIIGMLPMAFALGEGGEQNAPLGRAVIGGLSVATIATLFFVPTVFSGPASARRRSNRALTRKFNLAVWIVLRPRSGVPTPSSCLRSSSRCLARVSPRC